MKNKIKAFLIISFILLAINFSFSEYFLASGVGYFVDLPEGWISVDNSDLAVTSFSDPDNKCVFQVYSFKGNSFNNATDVFSYIKEHLRATGDGDLFAFSGKDAVLADLTFNTGEFDVRGYFVFINGTNFDYAILSFTPLQFYDKYHDFLLSCIDSFTLYQEKMMLPGPISQYYYPESNAPKRIRQININGKKVNAPVDTKEIETTQILVEREARVLTTYKDSKNKIEAWNRFYRMIFKDNYARLKDYVDILTREYNLNSKDSTAKASAILSDMQNFQYNRTNTAADLSSPLAAAYSESGDCDTRALLLAIILDYLNIESVMLVSTKYNHSVLGINVTGDGVKINFENKNFLFAELTKKHPLGVVDQKISDISNWIPMKISTF